MGGIKSVTILLRELREIGDLPFSRERSPIQRDVCQTYLQASSPL
jgi:hypothetical protein